MTFIPLAEQQCYNTLWKITYFEKFFKGETSVWPARFFTISVLYNSKAIPLFCSLTLTPFSNTVNNIHLCLQICDLYIFFQVKRINMFCTHVILRRRQVMLYNTCINEFFSQSNEALQPELNYSHTYLQNMKIECFSKEHKQFPVHSFSYFFPLILWFSHHVH